MTAYRTQTHTGTVSQIEDAVANLTQLGEECREVCDNTPDSLQSTDRYSQLDDSANNLESLDIPEIPDHITDESITYMELVPRRRNYAPSRATRRDNAVSILSAALSAIESTMEKLEDQFEDESTTDDEARDHHDELAQLHSDLQEIIDAADGCEFPGMRG